MGHERNGLLPVNGRWRRIVAGIAGADVSPAVVADLAAQTLRAVRGRLNQVERDEGVRAAFGFLVGLSLAARTAALRPDPVAFGEDRTVSGHPILSHRGRGS